MDYDKLIELLQHRARRKKPFIAQGEIWTGGMVKDELCAEAATAIETLRAENEKLRADWEKYQPREHWETLNEAMGNLRADLARVTAERDMAIKDIWAAKWVSCKYGTDCDFISAMTGCPDCAGCSNWKWRGIKED